MSLFVLHWIRSQTTTGLELPTTQRKSLEHSGCLSLHLCHSLCHTQLPFSSIWIRGELMYIVTILTEQNTQQERRPYLTPTLSPSTAHSRQLEDAQGLMDVMPEKNAWPLFYWSLNSNGGWTKTTHPTIGADRVDLPVGFSYSFWGLGWGLCEGHSNIINSVTVPPDCSISLLMMDVLSQTNKVRPVEFMGAVVCL